MSASFYDLLKYAATGIASPDMTYYDKMRASMLMGGVVKTLTGIPPLSFKADGSPLISWSMKGNGSQTGTPTPDAPIMPEFVGVRTGNLWPNWENYSNNGVTITKQTDGLHFSGTCTSSANITVRAEIKAGTYTLAANANRNPANDYDACVQIYINSSMYSTVTNRSAMTSFSTFTISSDIASAQYRIRIQNGVNYDGFILQPMLNSGSTALPYEPYGWKVPLTCAGQTVPVYLGQVSTVRRIKKKVFNGDESISNYDTNYNRFYVTISDMKSEGVRLTQLFSTHFQCIYDGRSVENVPNNSVYTGGGGDSQRLFIKTEDFTNRDSFKDFLAQEYAAGHPVTVWYVLAEPETGIVNEPLCKIGDYADELHSTDAAATIPTAKGQNTLTVDTPIQPSEMTITYRG